MAQRIGILNGSNLAQDKDFGAFMDVFSPATSVMVSGLAVTTNSVGTGRCLIQCTRTSTTPNEDVWVVFENTTAVTIDTSGTKKVWVAVTQANINDGSLNTDVYGLNIASIQTGANYPSSNYMPLASITGGVITDAIPTAVIGSHSVQGIMKHTMGTPIASATTTDLSTVVGNKVHVTGTATITSLGTLQAGTEMCLIFDSTAVLTHNGTSLVLPGSANITTATWDIAYFVSEGSGNWRCSGYQKANGQSIVASVDINGQTAITSPGSTDSFIEYNVSASANRKILFSDLKGAISKFGGDGSDGALNGSADITLTGSNSTLITKQYSSISAGSMGSQAFTNTTTAGSNTVFNMASTGIFKVGCYVKITSSAGTELAKVTVVTTNVSITVGTTVFNHTLTTPSITRLTKMTVTPTNCVVLLKCKGNADFTNWIFDFAGVGGVGQVGQGAAAQKALTDFAWSAPIAGGGSYQGGNVTAPTALIANVPTYISRTGYPLQPGSGGGGGGQNQSSNAGGTGGNGGGCLGLEVAGNVTLQTAPTGGTTIYYFMFNGLNGTQGAGANCGSGGGGAGGMIWLAYIGSLAGSALSAIANVLGGIGGAIWNGGGFAGGGGTGGASLFNFGTSSTGYVASTTGGAGGNGGNGGTVTQQVNLLA